MNVRSQGTVEGTVQGVGFRPFIHRLALRYNLAGYVANTPHGVELQVEGPSEAVERFFASILAEHPPLARIHSLERKDGLPLGHESVFEIKDSLGGRKRSTLIPPDVSVCKDCLDELFDPSDRRHRYPFINCINCGPRYTIIRDIPYDRAMTTMAGFTMCPACRSEYEDPADRRFHAQPNACPRCGPALSLYDTAGQEVPVEDPLAAAIELIKAGLTVAVKGLGGFHLAVDATQDRAVLRLRRKKNREEKPLAVMVPDLRTAVGLASISGAESELLASAQRPIVLVTKRPDHGLSEAVAPGNPLLGLMLPYTPLHHLLLAEGGFRALVMTSGNISEEPIAAGNQEAFRRLAGIADAFLAHNRGIHVRTDDSVTRVVEGRPRQIRRSRGYVPAPLPLPGGSDALPSVLALGAHLKNTVCLTRGNQAFMSQHVGDLENMETLESFKHTIEHLQGILEIKPAFLARDLHPDYLSSRFALERPGIPAIPVQHHHAHIASVLAENGIPSPVIGLSLDGAGLGDDGTIWGGEVLVADLVSYRRAAHLEHAYLPGGDAAAREPWRMALSCLYRAYGTGLYDTPIPLIRHLDRSKAEIMVKMMEKSLNSPLTSSCGRLFDAAAALAGLRRRNTYEGQAAMELEMARTPGTREKYPWEITASKDLLILKTVPLIRALVEDVIRGEPTGVVSSRFHNTLIDLLAAACGEIGRKTGIRDVAMSGGVFQNATLSAGLGRVLGRLGFRVLTNSMVPANDGGIALGQAASAALRAAG